MKAGVLYLSIGSSGNPPAGTSTSVAVLPVDLNLPMHVAVIKYVITYVIMTWSDKTYLIIAKF